MSNVNDVKVLRTPVSSSFDHISANFLAKANPQNIVITSPRTGRKKKSTEIFFRAIESSGFTIHKINEYGAAIFRSNGSQTYKVDW
jgi:hypothetical protein